MKCNGFKYILILCLAIALFLKLGSVLSYLSYASVDIENVSSNDDATEKEEKKVETEYFAQDFLMIDNAVSVFEMPAKVIIPNHFNKLSYFPEVLTPPPSI
ncbi:hypothetical protein EA772_03550 [Pedobacter sp. G11]|uniref:hypothetical protein n=1 Tax=Pedobacter sp. G11 TaxID=2482728 RepID=UPI000F5E8465|nr:hypothetical protein [Pedobacter sp. G11]AZI24468.1 hypothetical protein EA772_03550 [Pedobacter sp. G11]